MNAAPAIVAVSARGGHLALRLAAALQGEPLLGGRPAAALGLPAAFLGPDGLRRVLADAFQAGRPLVLVMPVGAAVRLVAPLLATKHADPPVVVVDDAGRFAVPLVSSHQGGANALAAQVAAALGAQAVITTAAEAGGVLALDLLAQREGWKLAPQSDATGVAAALVGGEPIGCWQEAGDEAWWAEAPENLHRFASEADLASATLSGRLIVSDRRTTTAPGPGVVLYRPPTLAVGIGCVRGVSADEVADLVRETLRSAGLAGGSIACLATIDLKRDEAGISEYAGRLGVPVRYYTAAELASVPGPSPASPHALRAVGAPGVCEPAAILASDGGQLLVSKQKSPRVTVAVARIAPRRQGSLTVVGLGPGSTEGLTAEARQALLGCDTVVGYGLYVDFVRPLLGPRDYRPYPIGAEVERCREAIALARSGRRVALVCSGDGGVYGMAGLVLELYAAEGATAEADALRVVPGVTAGLAAAALLGAPLMSDFAAISLSDLMTPWEIILQRLEAAAAADVVVVLYNPASARRRRQLEQAASVLRRYRPPETPVGLVRNAGRPGESVLVTDLRNLVEAPVDMLTTVIVGSSMTRRIGNRLYTQRGYQTRAGGQGTSLSATKAAP